MKIGSIYKNRRHHPDRIFVVLKIRNMKGGYRKVTGIQIVMDAGPDDTAEYTEAEFAREFPLLMFAP